MDGYEMAAGSREQDCSIMYFLGDGGGASRSPRHILLVFDRRELRYGGGKQKYLCQYHSMCLYLYLSNFRDGKAL